MICAGIDAGSRTIKVVLLDANTSRVIGAGVTDQGVKQPELALALLSRVCSEAGVEKVQIESIVATGYGRDALDIAGTTVTEITCHARGVREDQPDVRTIIDIGGQDSKLVRMTDKGYVRDFVINDRCAAGTGRFLEVVASRLGVEPQDLAGMAERADSPATISSMCVVFAESEIVGLLSSGVTPENIVAGVQSAIASRIAAMAGRHIEEPVIFTGGVAMVPGMDKALETALGCSVAIARDPQLTGAYGAALLAAEANRFP